MTIFKNRPYQGYTDQRDNFDNCPQVFRSCGPISYLRKQYSQRKTRRSVESTARRLEKVKSVTTVTVSPSAPALEELHERVNMLQQLAFAQNTWSAPN